MIPFLVLLQREREREKKKEIQRENSKEREIHVKTDTHTVREIESVYEEITGLNLEIVLRGER